MVTRIRVEAEGSSSSEVEQTLQLAHESLVQDSPRSARRLMFGENDEGLVDAQAGEFVIERFARDCGGDAGHGAIVYRGRMTAHYAPPAKVIRLGKRSDAEPYAA